MKYKSSWSFKETGTCRKHRCNFCFCSNYILSPRIKMTMLSVSNVRSEENRWETQFGSPYLFASWVFHVDEHWKHNLVPLNNEIISKKHFSSNTLWFFNSQKWHKCESFYNIFPKQESKQVLLWECWIQYFLKLSPVVKKWYVLNGKIVSGLHILCCLNLKIQGFEHADSQRSILGIL